jgi:hypothetical protein
MSRPRSRIRSTAGVLVAGVLSLGFAMVPAQGVALPACSPVAAGTTVRVTTADFTPSDGVVDVLLTAIDTCGQVDTTFDALLVLAVTNVDGRTVPDETVQMTPADAGVRRAELDQPGEGLTFIGVHDATDEAYLGGTTVIVHGPQGYPVVDGLSISVSASTYRATGVTVDPDEPAQAVGVYVLVDGRILAAIEDADRLADVWRTPRRPSAQTTGSTCRSHCPRGSTRCACTSRTVCPARSSSRRWRSTAGWWRVRPPKRSAGSTGCTRRRRGS